MAEAECRGLTRTQRGDRGVGEAEADLLSREGAAGLLELQHGKEAESKGRKSGLHREGPQVPD